MQLAKLKESVRGVLFGALVAVCSSAFAAAEVWVSDAGSDGAAGTKDDPYGTIAFALTQCDAGGTVHVMAGTYEIAAEILIEQDVKVVGDGYETTTVKCTTNPCRVLHLKHADAVVSGLTLTGGSGWLSASTSAVLPGAGAYVEAGTLSDCHVTQNDCAANHGGGVYMTGSSSVVTNCLIDYNSSSGWGALSAGAYVGAGALLDDCDVTWNKKLSNNNSYGIGVQLEGGTVRRCRIQHNLLDGKSFSPSAGGVVAKGAGGLIDQCLIADNVVRDNTKGAGLAVELANAASTLTVQDTTIVANQTVVSGGGIYVEKGTVLFSNCVVQDNTVFSEPQNAEVKIAGGTVTFTGCVSPVELPGADNVVARLQFAETEDYTPCYHPAAVTAGWKRAQTQELDASFEQDADHVLPNEEVKVAAYATAGAGGGALSYRWDFGDGTGWSAATSEAEATHKYEAPGKYTIRLEASAAGVTGAKEVAHDVFVSPEVAHVVDPKTHPGHVPVCPYVDEETAATNIQDAVDAVTDGAMVLVHPGTYSVNGEVMVERGITLKSSDGKGVTTVKSGLPTSLPKDYFGATMIRRAVYVNHPQAVVEGFTFRDCSCVVGNAKSPTTSGTAVLIGPAGGLLRDCTVTASTIAAAWGGTLGLYGADAVVSNCVIEGNSESSYGATCNGVYVKDGLLTHSRISDNSFGHQNCKTVGLWMEGGLAQYLTITNNQQKNNKSTAGGAYIDGASAILANSLIAGNVAQGDAGGVYLNNGKLLNCTIVGNKTTGGKGGGVFATTNGRVYGCLLNGNESSSSDDGAGKPEWYGGNSGTYAYSCATKDFPAGSVDCGKGAVVFEPGTYKPIVGQPCIDLMPTSVYETLGLVIDDSILDLYAQPRVSNVKIDAGCAEYQKAAYEATLDLEARVKVGQPATFVVKDSGATGVEYSWRVDGGEWGEYSATANTLSITFTTAGNHGVEVRVKETAGGALHGPYGCATVIAPPIAYVVEPEQADADGHVAVFPYESWETAATNVADAVAVMCNGTTVVVSDGVYKVTAPIALTESILVRSVNGADHTVLRNVKSGDSSVHRVAFVNHAGACLDGFVLTNGQTVFGDQLVEENFGLGVQIGANGGRVVNCKILANINSASVRGTGIAVLGAQGVVSNCVIAGNIGGTHVNESGVGGFVKAGLVTHCIVSNNVNHGRLDSRQFETTGAGLAVHGGRVSHCVFMGNCFKDGDKTGAPVDGEYFGGGAVYMKDTAVVDNCLFVSNACDITRGGAVKMEGGTLLNCTICENSAGTGGGVWASDSSVIRNCIIQDNAATTATDFYGAPNVTYSLCPTGLPEGEGNVEKMAVFKPGWKHLLHRASPGVDAGSEEGYEEYLGGTDLFGHARVIGPKVDIGADEVSQNGLILMVR